MRQCYLIGYLVLMGFLFACTSTENVELATVTSGLPTSTMTLAPIPETPIPTKKKTSTPMATVMPKNSTPISIPEPVFSICSPLAEQTLDELFEIITDPYNPPQLGKDDRHHGTDFAYYRRKDRITIAGEIVQAILPGEVRAVVLDRLPYGNMVIVETKGVDLPPDLVAKIGIGSEESLYHLYAHFGTSPLVKVGQQVECGQALGAVGATGYNIVNPHLHLETRLGPTGADLSTGMAYYSTAASEQERNNYEWWRTSGVFRHFDPMVLVQFYLSY